MHRVRTFWYPDADLMPGAEHGDFVYELTRSDWSRQGKHKPTERGESWIEHASASGSRPARAAAGHRERRKGEQRQKVKALAGVLSRSAR